MEYVPLSSIPHFLECETLVRSLGFVLVDLKIIPQKTTVKIAAVIASGDAEKTVGVGDCEKVHRLLLPRLQALLGTDQTYMELSSPGTERNVKNAAEFSLFLGRRIRVWERNCGEWIFGKILSADEKSVTLQVENSNEGDFQNSKKSSQKKSKEKSSDKKNSKADFLESEVSEKKSSEEKSSEKKIQQIKIENIAKAKFSL